MFGIDSPELLVIAVVALIVIGPKELPGMLRSWGKWMAKMRGMASEFRGHVDEMVRQSELDEVKKQIVETTAGLDLQALDPTREVTVKATSTISSSVTLCPAAQSSHSYLSRRTVFSVVWGSRTPPHAGQSTFQHSSNNPIRAACRNAAMTCSSLRPAFDAKSRTLMWQSLWSGESRTRASMASATSAFADSRRILNIERTSASGCMNPSLRFCATALPLLNRYPTLTGLMRIPSHQRV